jgi:ubiquinone/menaquinone biosynthesis C-methylase UbiE
MNDTSSAYSFTGPIALHYDTYLGPMFFEAYAIEVVSRVDASSVQHALELCCGTGRVTNHLRRALRDSAKLVASDLGPDMLAVAKEKLKTADIEWKTIDAQQIPFDNNSFDLVVCCFGYMFTEDKSRAFAEALRVLRPTGTLLFTTWDILEHNEASYIFRKTLKKYFGDSLPDTYNLPFSMHDPSQIKELLQSTGFLRSSVEFVEKNSFCVSAKTAAYAMVQGGSLYNEIMKRNPQWLPEIQSAVESELASRFGAAPMIAPMRAILGQAWK